MRTLRIITGTAHPALAEEIVGSLKTKLCGAEVGRFPDGETKVRILEDVRGTDVFVIQPICPPQNENLMELLILIDAVERSSAERITAAKELVKRKVDVLPQVMKLARGKDLNAAIGACHVMAALKKRAVPALPLLIRLLEHDDQPTASENGSAALSGEEEQALIDRLKAEFDAEEFDPDSAPSDDEDDDEDEAIKADREEPR